MPNIKNNYCAEFGYIYINIYSKIVLTGMKKLLRKAAALPAFQGNGGREK